MPREGKNTEYCAAIACAAKMREGHYNDKGMIFNSLPLGAQQTSFIYASELVLITAMALVPLLGEMLLKRRNASNHETRL